MDLSTATLTNLITNAQFYQVNVTSVVVNWPIPANGSEGYVLDASTSNDFVPVFKSSATIDINITTLTINNLAAYTTYYFRVGGINWNNVINYTTIRTTHIITRATDPSSI